MARAVDEQRRSDLVRRCLPYLAEHGIARLSLRPLAAALGTSDRMLIHFFGTKDALVGRVLAETRPKVPMLSADRDLDVPTMANRAWTELTIHRGEQQARYRLLLEVMALALTQPEPYEHYARAAVYDWITPIATALQRTHDINAEESLARATVLISGLRGLATDRWVTGDTTRNDRAAQLLITAATTTTSTTDPWP